MKMTINNLMSIEHAEIDITGLTVIAGGNGSGKSTTLKIAAALACRQSIHMVDSNGGEAVQRGKTSSVVRRGCALASATIEDGGLVFSVSYPSNKTTGTLEIMTDALSCQRVLWSALSVQDRQRMIRGMIGDTEPTKEEFFSEALKVASESIANHCWITITSRKSWDLVHYLLSKKVTELRGQWKGVTNETYGTQKAETWGVHNADMEHMTRICKDAENAFNDAIGRNAISDHQRAVLQETANRQELDDKELRKEFAAHNLNHVALQKEFDHKQAEHKQALAAMEEQAKPNYLPVLPDDKSSIQCPHCGVSLVHVSGALEYHKPRDNEEEQKRVDHNAAEKKRVDAVAEQIHKMNQRHGVEMTELSSRISVAQQAMSRIDIKIIAVQRSNDARLEAQKKLKDNPAVDIDIPALKKAVDDAVAAIGLVKATAKAKEIHQEIKGLLEVLPIISTTGLRATVANRKINILNGYINKAASLLGIKSLSLDANHCAVMDGVSYQFLSESQQYLTDVALQWAFALHHKPQLMVIDRVSMFVGNVRGYIITKAKTVSPNVIIALSEKKDYVADVSKKGAMDAVYWVDGGKAEKIK